MFDYKAARNHMVESQIRTSDVTDLSVVKAFRTIAREMFVPKSSKALAYADVNIELEDNRVVMKPRDIAKLIQAADIKKTDIVLDVACGRGYSTAILSMLADTVIALEDTEERVERATASLAEAGADNAVVVLGDIKSGAREHGPFDVIFINGAVGEVQKVWLDQLANNGRLMTIVQKGRIGHASVFTKSGDSVGDRIEFDASAPILPSTKSESAFAF